MLKYKYSKYTLNSKQIYTNNIDKFKYMLNSKHKYPHTVQIFKTNVHIWFTNSKPTQMHIIHI